MSGKISEEQSAKIKKLIKSLSASDAGKALLEEALAASGLTVMQRLSPETFPRVTDAERLKKARHGVILDVETTGFDSAKDKVIELGMVRFRYDDEGILSIDGVLNQMNDPGAPLSEEIMKVTGIKDADLEGRSFDFSALGAFMEDVDMVIAHHADFDRKFMEKSFPEMGFDQLDWFCSMSQVKWLDRGSSSRSLEVLASRAGYSYASHRAASDCVATAFVLNLKNEEGTSAFSEMLQVGRAPVLQIIADRSPFESKEMLKEAGFQWCPDGVDTFGRKAWHKFVPSTPEELGELAGFLKKVYGKDVAVPMYEHSASSRFSGRKPGQETVFRTAQAANLKADADQRALDLLEP